MKKLIIFLFLITSVLALSTASEKNEKLSTLIITGQNNHNWKASYPVLKQILDQTGLFNTEIMLTPEKGGDMNTFNPDFSKYKLVILDYNGDPWSAKTNNDFLEYVTNGGGLIIFHAANNSFPNWKEYNEIIGLGGWYGRYEKDGPYVYYSNNKLVIDKTPGTAGDHGPRHEYEVKIRITDHPITKGLPIRWLHGSDELYQKLRGPAKNMEILATAYADTSFAGTGRDEPMLMTLSYGKGRIFWTAMGHADEGGGPAMQCVGFITTFLRGAEWAATGNVKQSIPLDFPNAAGVVLRKDFKEPTIMDVMTNIGSYDIDKSTKYLTLLQNYLRKEAGNEENLLEYEKMMINVLKSKESTVEAKRLILRELSWMGTKYSIPVIKKLVKNPALKAEAEFALARH